MNRRSTRSSWKRCQASCESHHADVAQSVVRLDHEVGDEPVGLLFADTPCWGRWAGLPMIGGRRGDGEQSETLEEPVLGPVVPLSADAPSNGRETTTPVTSTLRPVGGIQLRSVPSRSRSPSPSGLGTVLVPIWWTPTIAVDSSANIFTGRTARSGSAEKRPARAVSREPRPMFAVDVHVTVGIARRLVAVSEPLLPNGGSGLVRRR